VSPIDTDVTSKSNSLTKQQNSRDDVIRARRSTLLLALTERGLGTCEQVSIAGPKIVREQLDIAPNSTSVWSRA
jgi:hypothetical protein